MDSTTPLGTLAKGRLLPIFDLLSLFVLLRRSVLRFLCLVVIYWPMYVQDEVYPTVNVVGYSDLYQDHDCQTQQE